ncbi:MAG: hypothetical protein V3R57_07635 [Candidatus Bathyarchaeia archaeon]
MPYANYLYCEKCGEGTNLDIDYISTIEAYQKEGRKSAFINEKTIIWDYLIYACYGCGGTYKYTYRDVERLVREYFYTVSDKHKEHFEKLGEQWESEEQRLKAGKENEPEPCDAVRTKRLRDYYVNKK